MSGRRLIAAPRYQITQSQDSRLSAAISGVFDRFCRYVWPHCGVPGRWRGPEWEIRRGAERYEWREEDRAEFDRAVEWLLDSLLGPVRDARGFSEPRNALTRVCNPIYEGEPILPSHLCASLEAGIVGAAQSLGGSAPLLCGAGFDRAVRDFLREAFARLSDGVRINMGEWLNGLPKVGQSVKQMLARAARTGEGTVQVARRLREKLNDIGSQYLRHLAKREAGFAVEKGKQGEYVARGWRVPGALLGEPIVLPKYHRRCRCDIEVQDGTGYLIPVTKPGACPECLLWESRAHALIRAELGTRRGEAGAAQDGGGRARDAVPVPRSMYGYRPLRTRWSVPRPADWPRWIDRRDPWVARLTDAEAQAVRRYARSMDDADAVRWALRGRANATKADRGMRDMAQAFAMAVGKQAKETGTYYRGEHDVDERCLAHMWPGAVKRLGTIHSASVNRNAAVGFARRGSRAGRSVIWEFEKADGRSIEPLVHPTYRHQRERILDAEQAFVVASRAEQTVGDRSVTVIRCRRVAEP